MKHLIFKTKLLLPLSMAIGLLILPSIAHAGIVGGSLIVQQDGEVKATFLSRNASYTHTLSQVGGNANPLISTHTGLNLTGSVSLGTYRAGDVLNFSLLVHNTGKTFFTGSGLMNPDDVAHTMVTDLGNGSTQVGWEDLWNGGDKDYNDLIFKFSNTTTEGNPEENPLATPEPSTMILFGSGLLGLGAWRFRKQKK